jgi:hypothetical protein
LQVWKAISALDTLQEKTRFQLECLNITIAWNQL